MYVLGFALSSFKQCTQSCSQSPAKTQLGKMQLPFPSFPSQYFLSDTSAFVGSGQDQKQKELHNKICHCVATVWRKAIQISHVARDVPWFHPTWPEAQRIPSFCAFFYAQQSQNSLNLQLLYIFFQHSQGQKKLPMLSLSF